MSICFVQNSEQTATFALCNIDRLVLCNRGGTHSVLIWKRYASSLKGQYGRCIYNPSSDGLGKVHSSRIQLPCSIFKSKIKNQVNTMAGLWVKFQGFIFLLWTGSWNSTITFQEEICCMQLLNAIIYVFHREGKSRQLKIISLRTNMALPWLTLHRNMTFHNK